MNEELIYKMRNSLLTENISQMSLEVVRTGSMSLSLRTCGHKRKQDSAYCSHGLVRTSLRKQLISAEERFTYNQCSNKTLTFISDTPSVSRIHSEMCLNSPSSVIVTLFLLSSFGRFMYTLEIASIPCRVISVSMFASMHRKNTSSSILSGCSSSCKDERESYFRQLTEKI